MANNQSMKDLEEQLKKHLKDPDGYLDKTFIFSEPARVSYTLPFYYRKINKDGAYQKKESVMKIEMKYNPFTGEKLN